MEAQKTGHRMLMLRNLVSSLIEHDQITTTVAKAKETARLADKIITLSKKSQKHFNSAVLSVDNEQLQQPNTQRKLDGLEKRRDHQSKTQANRFLLVRYFICINCRAWLTGA